jgi:hypothetical protein
VKSVTVEEWLDSIKRAKDTRAKIRNIMSASFHHAMRYEWVDSRINCPRSRLLGEAGGRRSAED